MNHHYTFSAEPVLVFDELISLLRPSTMLRKKTLLRTLLSCGLLAPLLAQAQIQDTSRHQSLLATYEWNHWNQSRRYNWNQGALEYKTQGRQGALLGRFNWGQRFASQGWQAEVEAYPRISKKVYAYTGIGYSASQPVFPKWRSGASLFVNLPRAWEVEGGVRYLYFNQPIWMGTTGLGKYVGNWFLQTRSFVSLNNSQGIDQSYFFTARYYLPSGTDYVWGQLGTGVSPDENGAAQLQVPNLQRQNIAAGIRTTVRGRHLLLGTLGYARNEYRKGTYGSQLTVLVGYGVKF